MLLVSYDYGKSMSEFIENPDLRKWVRVLASILPFVSMGFILLAAAFPVVWELSYHTPCFLPGLRGLQNLVLGVPILVGASFASMLMSFPAGRGFWVMAGVGVAFGVLGLGLAFFVANSGFSVFSTSGFNLIAAAKIRALIFGK